MPSFDYEVLNGPGERLQGQIEAESQAAAVVELMKRGLHVLSLQAASKPKVYIRRNLGIKHIAFMTRQLASLLRAGVPLLKSLHVLEKQATDRRLQETLKDLRGRLREGGTLSEALEAHIQSFGPMYVSMVRAGETGGMLDDVLKRLGEYLYRELEMRGRIRAALAYPSLMILVGCSTVFVLLSFVIPKVCTLFLEAGRELPMPTQILISISGFFSAYWWLVLIAVITLFFSLRAWKQTRAGRLAVDRLSLKLPVFGDFVVKTETARMARVLGTLLGNGVPMLKALDVTATTLGNRVLSQNVLKISENVRHGDSLSKQLGAEEMFPPLMTNVVEVGEQSGSLDQALINLAEEYDGEIDRTIRTMLSLMEPMLIILVGGAIGFIVLALLLPIFDLNEVIQ